MNSPGAAIPSSWGFHQPVEIHWGAEALDRLATLPFVNPLIVTTKGAVARGTAARVTAKWSRGSGVGDKHAASEPLYYTAVAPNPDLGDLDDAARVLARHPIDAIIGLGGGSVLDTAKVFSVLLASPGPFSLAGHFRDGLPLPDCRPLPVIAIPTTAGTGSEVTPFATVWDSIHHKKFSLASAGMFPRLALLDPSLTHSLPWADTLPSGLDALCQALESIWNRFATPLTLGIAQQAASLAWHSLRHGTAILESPALRSDLMQASLLAGIAISQTRTALCHSISYPITARFAVPHGIACAVWMPQVLRFNLPADDGRLQQTARILGFPSADAFADALDELLVSLGAWDAFHSLVPDRAALSPHLNEMLTPDRADNNLRPATISQVEAIIQDPSDLS
jgi:phosphonate metabolism-associated iron-containing alcohol dehydrogenase